MHEATPGGNSPREQLVSLLQADFTPPDKIALAQRAHVEGNALAGLLAQTRGIEDIDARYESDENRELGEAVERILEPAPVTISFKGFIAHEVRRAHARQSKVDDVVSPDRLGLLSGEGVFDTAQAKDIEGRTLRGYAFDIINRYTVAPAGEGEAELPPLMLKPGVRPSDYTEAIKVLDQWAEDYANTYNEDPGEGLEIGAYLAAAPQAEIVSEEDPDWSDALERLRRLRDEQ